MNATAYPVQAIFDRRPVIEAVSFDNDWMVVEGGTVLDIEWYLDENKEPIEDRADFNDAWYYVVQLADDDQIVIPSHAYRDMLSYSNH